MRVNLKFGLSWLFAAILVVALILAASQFGPVSAYLMAITTIPVLTATFTRIELGRLPSRALWVIVFTTMIVSGLLSIVEIGLFMVDSPAHAFQMIVISFVFGSVGGLFLSLFPFGLYCFLIPFLETYCPPKSMR